MDDVHGLRTVSPTRATNDDALPPASGISGNVTFKVCPSVHVDGDGSGTFSVTDGPCGTSMRRNPVPCPIISGHCPIGSPSSRLRPIRGSAAGHPVGGQMVTIFTVSST